MSQVCLRSVQGLKQFLALSRICTLSYSRSQKYFVLLKYFKIMLKLQDTLSLFYPSVSGAYLKSVPSGHHLINQLEASTEEKWPIRGQESVREIFSCLQMTLSHPARKWLSRKSVSKKGTQLFIRFFLRNKTKYFRPRLYQEELSEFWERFKIEAWRTKD